MFRYIFALLLLISSYRSLGVPVPSSAPVSLTNLLTALSTSCENRFLSDQIKNKLDYCADLSSPHGEKQLECLIFYDINIQLCKAVGASKLKLTEDYSAKINEEQDVNLLCATAKDWVFSNLTEFTRYKNTVEKVFKHPVTCGKVCGVEDFLSDDANIICKYFKWGTDMLKDQVDVPPVEENIPQPPSETGIENKPLTSSSNDQNDVQIKNTSTSNILNSETASTKNEETVKTEAVKSEASENGQEPEPLSANSAPPKKSESKLEESIPVAEDPLLAISDQADKPAEISSPDLKNEGQKASPDTTLTKPQADVNQKLEVDKEIQLLNNELEHKEPVIETPEKSKDKQPSDSVEYQDADEGKEGLGDMQGDDDGDDDSMVGGVINKVNEQNDQKVEQKETENLKTIVVSGITGESGLYPSLGQDGYTDDDDDHFFSFFLTAVIMVVLIYVLYHNKNKVGKVFFGLILEGRQAGRRRNSRGHAYRRLDTLEQAMSTNSAAPPSKIIY